MNSLDLFTGKVNPTAVSVPVGRPEHSNMTASKELLNLEGDAALERRAGYWYLLRAARAFSVGNDREEGGMEYSYVEEDSTQPESERSPPPQPKLKIKLRSSFVTRVSIHRFR